MKENAKKITAYTSSGNVFLDIGFSPEEATELMAKSQLIIAISRSIKKRKLTEKQAAKICRVAQSTLSKILRGRMKTATIDRLILWLRLLGHSVEIRVGPYNPKAKTGKLVIVC